MSGSNEVSTERTENPSAIWRPQVRKGLDFAGTYDERIIVTLPYTGSQIRLTPSAVELLQACDGLRDYAALSALVAPELVTGLEPLLEKFEQLELLEPDVGRTSAMKKKSARFQKRRLFFRTKSDTSSRFRYRSPGTIEFAILDADTWVERLRIPTRLVMAWPSQALVWLVSIGGLVLWISHSKAFIEDLSNQITPMGGAIGFLLLFVSTCFHELAHAGALANRGGRVRRLGFLLLYGSPSMYCDVSDAWRLSRKHRVLVSLAGVRVNLLLAGFGGLIASLTHQGALHDTAVITAGGNALMAVINLCPLVKFDGYLALIGWLDAPNLRRRCMDETSEACRYFLFGGKKPTQITSGRILFGLGATIMGPTLVVGAVLGYQSILLATLGVYGAVLLFLTYSVALYVIMSKLIGAVIQAVARGATRIRITWVCFAIGASAIMIVALVQVPIHTISVFYSEGSTSYLVLPSSMAMREVSLGQRIELRRPGVFLKPLLGIGTVCSLPTRHAVPVGVGGTLLLSTTVTTMQYVTRICSVQAPRQHGGIAEISRGSSSLANWLRTVVIDPFLSSFQTGRFSK